LNEKPDCDNCRKIHENKLEDTPCYKCIPEVLDENKDALRVYLMARNQIISVGMGGIVDISFEAVKFIMDLYEIENQRIVFEKVLGVARYFINEENEKNK